LKGIFKAGYADERYLFIDILKFDFYDQFFNLKKRAEGACEDLHDQSAKGWNEYEDLEGNHFTKLKYGYGKVIEEISTRIPQDLIKLNEIVERIDYREDDVIRITVYNSNEKKRKSYTASAIISTLPLGVLKRSHQEIFTPKLPSNKINSIEKLGFGIVDKLWVVFDQPFDDDFDSLQFIWRNDVNFDLEARKRHNLKDVEFCKAIDNLFKLPIFDNVLIGFLVGEKAVFIENLDDECLLDIIKELVAKFFPNFRPKPIKIVRSRWASNSLSRGSNFFIFFIYLIYIFKLLHHSGSYSYIRVGTTIDDMLQLAEPIV
jgi:spermine oxidase